MSSTITPHRLDPGHMVFWTTGYYAYDKGSTAHLGDDSVLVDDDAPASGADLSVLRSGLPVGDEIKQTWSLLGCPVTNLNKRLHATADALALARMATGMGKPGKDSSAS